MNDTPQHQNPLNDPHPNLDEGAQHLGFKPTRAEKGEVIGGGHIIGHRQHGGRITVSNYPFEHANRDAALAEATRLAEKTPGRQFVILAVIDTVLIDKVA